MARRALVTGGSGYVGSALVEALRRKGYQTTVFDRIDAHDRPVDVALRQGDIRDATAVAEACRGVDVVYHAVAQVPLVKDQRLLFEVNVDGTRNVLDAVMQHRVAKVVLLSSSAVFGVPERCPVVEADEPRPREAYGRAKLAAERLAEGFVGRGADISIVRPRTVLGPGRLGIFQVVFEWVRRGRPVWVLGRGDNRYQFVQVDDLVDACLRAGERPGPDTFHVGAERFGTMRETLEALCRHAGTGSRVRSLPAGLATRLMDWTGRLRLSPLGAYHALMYGRDMFFDVSRARERLGWSPRKSNDEMVVESYDHYVDHHEEILGRTGASHHRSAVRKGILKLLEYLPVVA